MQTASLRYFGAALWPATIWTSLTHLDEHAADDYVERTSPIVGTAIGFWICVAILVGLELSGVHVWAISTGGDGDDAGAVHHIRRSTEVVRAVVWFFLPLLYIAGFAMFFTRDQAFPRKGAATP